MDRWVREYVRVYIYTLFWSWYRLITRKFFRDKNYFKLFKFNIYTKHETIHVFIRQTIIIFACPESNRLDQTKSHCQLHINSCLRWGGWGLLDVLLYNWHNHVDVLVSYDEYFTLVNFDTSLPSNSHGHDNILSFASERLGLGYTS